MASTNKVNQTHKSGKERYYQVTLQVSPNENFIQWKQSIRDSTLAAHGHNHAKAIASGATDPKLTDKNTIRKEFRKLRSALPKDKDGQIDQIDEEILMSDVKAALEAADKFESSKGNVLGDIISTLSPRSFTRIKQYPGTDQRCRKTFHEAFDEADYLAVIFMAQLTHLNESSVLGLQKSGALQTLKNIKQQPKETPEAYGDRYQIQIEKMDCLGITYDAEEAIRDFLFGLDSEHFLEYVMKLEDPRSGYGFPQTIEEAVTGATTWYSSHGAIKELMWRTKTAEKEDDVANVCEREDDHKPRKAGDGKSFKKKQVEKKKRAQGAGEENEEEGQEGEEDDRGSTRSGRTTRSSRSHRYRDEERHDEEIERCCRYCLKKNRRPKVAASHHESECKFKTGEYNERERSANLTYYEEDDYSDESSA